MITALEEIKFRADSCSTMMNIQPGGDRPPSKKAFGYRICSGDAFGAYIYNTVMGMTCAAKNNLTKMLELASLAEKIYEQDSLISLEYIYMAKSLLSEDLAGISMKVVDATNTKAHEDSNPLYAVLSCLRIGQGYQVHMDHLKKYEAKKYSSALPGTVSAIEHIVRNDEKGLIDIIDKMLLAHHKEANNRHSRIYNSPFAFLSLTPYLIIDLAKFFGMDIQKNISENKQILKLGLSSPADFPKIPKNHKMPLEVDYITAATNIID